VLAPQKAGSPIAIRLKDWPHLIIRGDKPDARGWFELNSFDFLSPNLNGWNQFNMELAGRGRFQTNFYSAFLSIESMEAIDIAKGFIRQRDSRFSGDEALNALRARNERIKVLVKWMKKNSHTKTHRHGEEDNDKDSFAAYWNPIFFPRQGAGERPENYSAEALRRDWDEALPWIYLQYKWDSVVSSLKAVKTLVRVEE
jgi:hypothetical protein